MDLGILILRLAVGLSLAAHGMQKLFGWFGGYGLAGTGGWMESLGFVPGRRAAMMAGLAETMGGLLLALGAATPLAAGIVVSVMLVAAISAHLEKGFFNHNGGYELPLILASVALSVAFAGPGSFSVDRLLGLGWSGLPWGLGALALGLIGGATQLASRHRPAIQASAETKTA